MESSTLKVYILDDEPLSRELLAQSVERSGWQVSTFSTAREFFMAQQAEACDLALVDIGLPDQDGFEVTRWLTRENNSGVVMVTARQDFESRIMGLEVGADAYLTKPVEPVELTATIDAVMRRLRKAVSVESSDAAWDFDPRKWVLLTPSGEEVDLSRAESVLLDMLIRADGEAVSRDKIIAGLGHSSEYYSTGRLDTLVCRLRNKILGASEQWQPIVTLRGIGYAFDGEVGS